MDDKEHLIWMVTSAGFPVLDIRAKLFGPLGGLPVTFGGWVAPTLTFTTDQCISRAGRTTEAEGEFFYFGPKLKPCSTSTQVHL